MRIALIMKTTLEPRPAAGQTTAIQLLGKETQRFLMAISGLAAFYIFLIVYLSSFGAFWSPDCGARFAMIRDWVEHGNLIHWYYPSADLDPTGRIHPLEYFLFHTPHSYYAMYEPLFPLLCGVLYRMFGFIGLSIIPGLSGLGTAVIVYAMARRVGLQNRILLSLVISLGTPLMIYSVVFWDHVVMMLVAAASGYWVLCSLQENKVQSSVWAGAVLGLGIWIHELIIALFLAVVLASLPLLWHHSGRRLVLGLNAGFIPMAILWAGTNWLVYGAFGGPHLSANMGSNTDDHPFSLSLILNQQRLAHQAFEQLLGTTISPNMGTWTYIHTDLVPLFIVFGFLLVFYWLTTSFLGAAWQFAPLISLVAAILALYLVFRIQWAHGLFLATPLLIPALAIPWDANRIRIKQSKDEKNAVKESSHASLFYAWLSRATWFYILIVFMYPGLPGADWGSRYLLPVLPFLALLAFHALEEQYQASAPRWRRLVGGCVAVLVGSSICCQLEGLNMVQRNIRYNQELIQRARSVTSPVIIYDDIAMAPELAAVSLPQAQFMIRSIEDWTLLLKIMRRSRVTEFTYIGADIDMQHILAVASDGYPGFSDPPFTMAESRPFLVNHHREDGVDLVFIKCVLSPGNK